MNGYIINKTPGWRHAMKRSIGPGHKVPLDELYEQYGVKHEIKEGKPFVEWLRAVKLSDSGIWDIVYEENPEKAAVIEEQLKESVPVEVAPVMVKDMESSDVINMSVRTAREQFRKITNLKLLKYSLNEARQLAGKDTLCKMLRRRIRELELTRR